VESLNADVDDVFDAMRHRERSLPDRSKWPASPIG